MNDSNNENEFDDEFEIEEDVFEDDSSFEEIGEEEYFEDVEGSLGEDDWDDESFNDVDGRTKPAVKKKMSTNAIIIIVAVIVGVGFMFMQLAKTPKDKLPEELPFRSALTPAGQVNNPVTASVKKIQEDEAHKNNQDPQTGFLNDPSSFDETKDGIEDTVSLSIDEQSIPPMPSMFITVETEIPDLPAPLTPMPDIEAPTAPVDMAENVIAQEIEQPQQNAAALLQEALARRELENNDSVLSEAEGEGAFVEDVVGDGGLSVEQEKSEDMMGIVDEAPMPDNAAIDGNGEEDPLKEQAEMPVVSPVVEPQALGSISQDEFENVQKQVLTLEDELNVARQALEKKEKELNNRIKELEQQLEVAQKEKLQSKLQEKAVDSAPQKPISAPTPKKVVKTQKSQVRAKWELRAARPGEAWVAHEGQKEMRSLVIGDSLSGIGTITSITYDGQQWIVRGTQGRITQ